MGDVLTPEERAAIEAFPKSKIQRVATGVSGIEGQGYKWDGKTLVAIDPEAAKRRASQWGPRAGAKNKVESRRRVVKQKFISGMTPTQIANEMKTKLKTIKNDIWRMGLKRGDYPIAAE